jgi:hypothetical protein
VELIGAFVKTTTDVPGGCLQLLHGVYKHTKHDAHRGVGFAYLDDVEEGTDIIETVKFEKDLLVLEIISTQRDLGVIVAESVAQQAILLVAADETLQLIPIWSSNQARTKIVNTRNFMCIPFPLLILYVVGGSCRAYI